MARPRCYETAALKQRAYRERKNQERNRAINDQFLGKNLDADSREGEALKPEENRSVTRACSHPETSSVPFETKKVGEFRMLVLPEMPKEEATMPVVKPLIYRNDYGAVISESAWGRLQEKKRVAAENGYELDEYSQ